MFKSNYLKSQKDIVTLIKILNYLLITLLKVKLHDVHCFILSPYQIVKFIRNVLVELLIFRDKLKNLDKLINLQINLDSEIIYNNVCIFNKIMKYPI